MQRLIQGLPLLILTFGAIALADFWGRVSHTPQTPVLETKPSAPSARTPQQVDKRTNSRKL